ncbi:MAG: type II toxin-antitoxin system RelE/ParE family toxin [Nitrospinae bacterium]|nr:type II toxin-antitoxin system RelE/ParE family toxin [Nitrospinota bacterium]
MRTGDFRIIYQTLKAGLIVAVVKVAHRREAYR